MKGVAANIGQAGYKYSSAYKTTSMGVSLGMVNILQYHIYNQFAMLC